MKTFMTFTAGLLSGTIIGALGITMSYLVSPDVIDLMKERSIALCGKI